MPNVWSPAPGGVSLTAQRTGKACRSSNCGRSASALILTRSERLLRLCRESCPILYRSAQAAVAVDLALMQGLHLPRSRPEAIRALSRRRGLRGVA